MIILNDLRDEIRVATVIRLFELKMLPVAQTENYRDAITNVLQQLFMGEEEIEYWLNDFEIK